MSKHVEPPIEIGCVASAPPPLGWPSVPQTLTSGMEPNVTPRQGRRICGYNHKAIRYSGQGVAH
jgi:hypothetical protein